MYYICELYAWMIKILLDISNYPISNKFLSNNDSGLGTPVLQNGLGVSGGQAQMIAFLRAMIKKL